MLKCITLITIAISAKVELASSDVVSTEVFEDNTILELNDAVYYAMPRLFDMEEYRSCVGVDGAYCLGSFELSPIGYNSLFQTMQRYSANWLENFNHTRLHRGLCLTRSCLPIPSHIAPHQLETWFETCVNASTTTTHNLTASLYHLDYCTQGSQPTPPLGTNEKAFAAFVISLLALTTISTIFDMKLYGHTKKEYGWVISWSLRSSWRTLVTPAPASHGTDLSCFDGLRLFFILLLMILHVSWVNILSYISNVKNVELTRRTMAGMFLTNSTMVVQSFFLMSSFLLAHKLLKEAHTSFVNTFIDTVIYRFIRYLSADMQLYVPSLLLTLLLRNRSNALPVIGATLMGVIVLKLGVVYAWTLVPNFALQNYETILTSYKGNLSMLLMYSSPLSSAVSTLAGLTLAFLQTTIRRNGASDSLINHKVFRWVSIWSNPGLLCFIAFSPLVVGPRISRRLPAIILAALERPIFIAILSVAVLGAINGIYSPWRRWQSYGYVFARLSYGAYLVHICVAKSIFASRDTQSHLEIKSVVMETIGIYVTSFLVALPLALLVELPSQRLYKEIRIILQKRSDKKKLTTKHE